MADIVSRGYAEITIMDTTDSRRLVSYISSNQMKQVIFDPDSSSYLPNYKDTPATLTPVLKMDGSMTNIVSQARRVNWYVQVNSINNLLEVQNDQTHEINPATYELKIKRNIVENAQSMKYMVEIVYSDPDTGDDYVTMAEFEVMKITNGTSGQSSIVATLTNDSDLVPTSEDGTGGDYTDISTTMVIYEGTTDITREFNISMEVTPGLTGSKPKFNSYQVSSMTEDKGAVTFTATGRGLTLRKVFTISKLKNGETTELIRLKTNDIVIKKDINDSYSPAYLEVYGQSKLGREPFKPYNGIFKIAISQGGSDATDFTVVYTSPQPEHTARYTPAKNISKIKVDLYAARDATIPIDSQIVQIVVDGKDSILPLLATPKGTTLINSKGVLEAEMFIYKGIQTLTADSYSWYRLDATHSGDATSGVGWQPINEMAASQVNLTKQSTKLTVFESAIAGTETFMCVALHRGIAYKATVTFTDLQDPYTVSVLGSGLFKNGEGTKAYTCKVYHRGAEVDIDGTLYTYTWSMYSAANTKITNFTKTGKTIQITGAEISDAVSLVCTVTE